MKRETVQQEGRGGQGEKGDGAGGVGRAFWWRVYWALSKGRRVHYLPRMQQFDQFRAAELFCPKCKVSRPVRERLLLILPHAELYDYRCQTCGTSVGQREVKAPPLSMQMARPPQPAALPRRAPRSAPRGQLPPRR